MNTSWIIHTHDEPLRTTQRFLRDIWQNAGLEGMLVPVYKEGGQVGPLLVEDPDQLLEADPFIPVICMSAAHLVAQLSRQRPNARLAAVLRPCEARAVKYLAESQALNLDNWLLIGVDCLAAFPPEDVVWRAEKPGGLKRLTDQALRFARQGGIAEYRNRPACQSCASPTPEDVDISIGLLGLPVHRFIMVTTRDIETAERLGLSQLIDGWAWPALVAQRFKTLAAMGERHTRVREYTADHLAPDLPDSPDELVDLLENCAPCQLCLEACPICSELHLLDGLLGGGLLDNPVLAEQWLAACVQCGLCEDACPKHRPLTAIIGRLSRRIIAEQTAV